MVWTIRKPNFETFGIGMAFGIPSSVFEPPLYLLAYFFYFWTNLAPILVELIVEHIIRPLNSKANFFIGLTITFYYR